ncbi:protein kinase [bacterium]|nr:protein kinase [bacterium]
MSKENYICVAITGKGYVPTTFVLDDPLIRVGRSSSNDIVLDPYLNAAVSRRHLVLRRKAANSWFVVDLESTRGTYLNGKRVTEETEIFPRDVIQLGLDGPMMMVTWRTGDETSSTLHRPAGSRLSPLPFPLALYGDFPYKYRVFQKLGEGGYGQVWRALSRQDRKWVAVKFLRPELLLSEGSDSTIRIDNLVQRFRREAELTRRLAEMGTPGIAQVYEVGGEPEEGFLYMVLEYIEGRSLDRILAKHGPLPAKLVCRYMLQVARSLDAAHNVRWKSSEDTHEMRGIVHRDVKPSNMIIRKKDNTAILCDFGIAAIEEGADRLTLPQVRVMTYKFTSPEVLIENTIAPATDLWGLAVTTFILLTGGHFPYDGIDAAETLRQIRQGHMNPLGGYRRGLHPRLLELVHQALSPRPEERPLSAREWISELEWLEATVIEEPDPLNSAETQADSEESAPSHP